MLTKQHIQERLSLAYVHAVAGRAGINLANPRVHDYGVDGTFQPVVRLNGRYVESGFPLDFQMKATTLWTHDQADVVYDLEAKTYNDLVLRDPDAIALVLILCALPPREDEWLRATETELILRNCCYWFRPAGGPSANVSTHRVRIPRQNLLTVSSLGRLMQDVRAKAKGSGSD